MIDFGGSVKLSTALASGFSVSLVILLTLYYQHANEINEPESATNGPAGVTNSPDTESGAKLVEAPATTTAAASPLEPADGHGVDKATCRKITMIFAKRAMRALNKCGKELKANYPEQEDYEKHFQCAVKCAMQFLGIVDKDFNFTKETMAKFFEEQYPEKYREPADRLSRKCTEQFVPLIDPKDEFCTSYGDYVKCLQVAVSDC